MNPHPRTGLRGLLLAIAVASISVAALIAGTARAETAILPYGEIALTGGTCLCPSDSTQVYLFHVATGHLSQLTHGPVQHFAVGWSPDGSRLLVEENGPRRHGLYSMRATGRSQIQLSKQTENEPSWSPDGRRVAYLSWNRDTLWPSLYVINANGTHRRLLANSVPVSNEFYENGDYSWAPNGKRIVFANGGSLVTVRTTGKPVRRATSTPFSAVSHPTWSPDGTRIAFWFNTRNGGPGPLAVGRSGLTLRRLTDVKTLPGLSSPPVWSPDSSWIAGYAGSGVESVMHPDGSGARKWNASWSGVSFSPNSTWLAYVGGQPHASNGVLYVANVDGSQTVQVLNDQSLYFDTPLWRGGTAETESG